MPKCKYCGARLSKFDNDICPVCGTKNPLEGVSSETVEITSKLDIDTKEFQNYKPKKRTTCFLLSLLIGWSGATFFYLGDVLVAIIWFVVTGLGLIGGLGTILGIGLSVVSPAIGYIIGIAASYLVNIIFGIVLLVKPNLRDKNKNFLK